MKRQLVLWLALPLVALPMALVGVTRLRADAEDRFGEAVRATTSRRWLSFRAYRSWRVEHDLLGIHYIDQGLKLRDPSTSYGKVWFEMSGRLRPRLCVTLYAVEPIVDRPRLEAIRDDLSRAIGLEVRLAVVGSLFDTPL